MVIFFCVTYEKLIEVIEWFREVAHLQSGSLSTWFRVELEFGNVGFWGEGKTGVPEGDIAIRRVFRNILIKEPFSILKKVYKFLPVYVKISYHLIYLKPEKGTPFVRRRGQYRKCPSTRDCWAVPFEKKLLYGIYTDV